MPTIDIRRHGRDILIPYDTLTELTGYTLTDCHLDRLAERALPNSSLREVLDTVLGELFTPVEHDHKELFEPFADQAPRGPAPCVGHDAAVLATLRVIKAEYDAEPFLIDDSDTATERDLAYLDRIIAALDLGDDEPTGPAPEYRSDQDTLHRALVDAARPHITLDATALTQIHALVTLLTTADFNSSAPARPKPTQN
ncbi:hypothetical protein IU510_20600 [Nocardia cyriacigeorgica]|uniref:hypothetical protein n=1 Tax=Nocardia cyriacigeorgica TaxID=135487 RepID=UPI00189421F1|nr:hypothetical protein [Nocardia cyriacigeorgica]MBF6100462.1 hypothetical protein [Nocardia cyriacigeorgica]MBF6320296.1 hypothetical protein [Nocardia cyriacigeorgica]MBF6346328.1 hypothetical protein [Nocardia cyriacigeorgica]MBF6534218.1 hypothetical protein [Nocardia cyriacigeorgica]